MQIEFLNILSSSFKCFHKDKFAFFDCCFTFITDTLEINLKINVAFASWLFPDFHFLMTFGWRLSLVNALQQTQMQVCLLPVSQINTKVSMLLQSVVCKLFLFLILLKPKIEGEVIFLHEIAKLLLNHYEILITVAYLEISLTS